eukprot:1152661-Pelagomonas_calceolata.AAC.7
MRLFARTGLGAQPRGCRGPAPPRQGVLRERAQGGERAASGRRDPFGAGLPWGPVGGGRPKCGQEQPHLCAQKAGRHWGPATAALCDKGQRECYIHTLTALCDQRPERMLRASMRACNQGESCRLAHLFRTLVLGARAKVECLVSGPVSAFRASMSV